MNNTFGLDGSTDNYYYNESSRDQNASDSQILEEEYDPNYEPTLEDVREYAQYLGMDDSHSRFYWIAREGLRAPLPKCWKPCKTEGNEVYYFNFDTGQSFWEHPCDIEYKALFHKALEMEARGEKMKLPPGAMHVGYIPDDADDDDVEEEEEDGYADVQFEEDEDVVQKTLTHTSTMQQLPIVSSSGVDEKLESIVREKELQLEREEKEIMEVEAHLVHQEDEKQRLKLELQKELKDFEKKERDLQDKLDKLMGGHEEEVKQAKNANTTKMLEIMDKFDLELEQLHAKHDSQVLAVEKQSKDVELKKKQLAAEEAKLDELLNNKREEISVVADGKLKESMDKERLNSEQVLVLQEQMSLLQEEHDIANKTIFELKEQVLILQKQGDEDGKRQSSDLVELREELNYKTVALADKEKQLQGSVATIAQLQDSASKNDSVVNTLKAKIVDQESDIAAKSEDLEKSKMLVQSQGSASDVQLMRVQEELSRTKTELVSVQSALHAAQLQCDRERDNARRLEMEQTQLQTDIQFKVTQARKAAETDCQKQIDDLQRTLVQKNGIIREQEEDKSMLERNVKNQDATVKSYDEKTNQQITAHRAKVNTLEDKVALLERSTTGSMMGSATATVDCSNCAIKTQQHHRAVAELEGRSELLTSQLRTKTLENTRLADELQVLQERYDRARDNVLRVQSEADESKNENMRIMSDSSRLKLDLREQQDENERVRRENVRSVAEITRLKGEFDRSQQEISKLNAQIRTLQEELREQLLQYKQQQQQQQLQTANTSNNLLNTPRKDIAHSASTTTNTNTNTASLFTPSKDMTTPRSSIASTKPLVSSMLTPASFNKYNRIHTNNMDHTCAQLPLLSDDTLDEGHVEDYIDAWAVRERELIAAERSYLMSYKLQLQSVQSSIKEQQARWVKEKTQVKQQLHNGEHSDNLREQQALLKQQRIELDDLATNLNQDIEKYKQAKASVDMREQLLGQMVSGADKHPNHKSRKPDYSQDVRRLQQELMHPHHSQEGSALSAGDKELIAMIATTAAASESTRLQQQAIAQSKVPGPFQQSYQVYRNADNDFSRIMENPSMPQPLMTYNRPDMTAPLSGDFMSTQIRNEQVKLLANRSKQRSGLHSEMETIRGLSDKLHSARTYKSSRFK